MNKYIVSEKELKLLAKASVPMRGANILTIKEFLKDKQPVKPLNRENVSDLIDKHMVVDGLAVAHGMGKSIESPAPICLYNNKQVDDFITGILNLTPEPSEVIAEGGIRTRLFDNKVFVIGDIKSEDIATLRLGSKRAIGLINKINEENIEKVQLIIKESK